MIKGAIKTRLFLGMGFKVMKNPEKYADEIHKQYMKPWHLLKVQVGGKNDIWSADLINFRSRMATNKF